LHFTRDEYAGRQEMTRKAMLDRGLDGMLLFKIEDMYWLCGLDTDGFSIFHAMFIGTNDELTHVSRGADLANVRYSSVCDDVRIWVDAEGNPKSKAIKDTLASHRMQGKTLGIQLDTMGLTPRLYEEIRAELSGWCELVDASDLIRKLRLVKSPQELEYHRRAGTIIGKMRDVAISGTRASVDGLRVHDGGHVAAYVDGAAPDIREQLGGARSQHDVLHAYDPDRSRRGAHDVAGRAGDRHRRTTRDHHARSENARDRVERGSYAR